MKRLRLFGMALLLALPLVACGPGNTVRLIYSPAVENVLPQPAAPRVTVVMFEDQRTQQSIGVLRDGTVASAGSNVADWVSRSLGDELARDGQQVSYSPTMTGAQNAHPPYIISGVVREVWLKELNPTTMTATIRITVTLRGKKGVLYSENLSSTQERKGLPSATAAETLLADTLRDVLQPTAKKIETYLK